MSVLVGVIFFNHKRDITKRQLLQKSPQTVAKSTAHRRENNRTPAARLHLSPHTGAKITARPPKAIARRVDCKSTLSHERTRDLLESFSKISDENLAARKKTRKRDKKKGRANLLCSKNKPPVYYAQK